MAKINERYSKLAMQWMQGYLAHGDATTDEIMEHFPFKDGYFDIAASVAFMAHGKWRLQPSLSQEIFD